MDVTMPQLGETVTEGTITRWFKQVGETIAADEPLFEVSTDKVDSEVPAPAAGVVSEILVPEGDTVPVGARLAVISDSVASEPAVPAAVAPEPAAPAPAPPEPAPEPPPAVTWAPGPSTIAAPPPPAAAPPPPPPPPPAPAPETAPVAPAASTEPSVVPETNGGGIVTSPLVRRMIAEQGLDPAQIHGTGEGGRITRNDVVEAGRSRGAPAAAQPPTSPAAPAAPAPAPAPPEAAPVAEAPAVDVRARVEPAAPAPQPVAEAVAPPAPAPARPAPSEPEPHEAPVGTDEIVPFDNIRRRTAEHMVRSKATSAHVYTSVRVDFERIERTRRINQAEWKREEGFSLTYLPFIVRAVCDVVHDYPHVNASVDGQSLVVHHNLHLGIAVDLDFKGLVAPVIRNADGKRLRLVAREIRDLAARAKSKQLGPDEVVGGTFTITNMGPFGTTLTLPIINQPQVAIMATDGIRKEPVVVEGRDGEDSIAIHHVGALVLAWDHRAFDGAYAASFLNEVRTVLETRDWDAELA